jgi:hypothetical protein
MRPIACVATAADEDRTYAMLVRRRGESLLRLLSRLDQAIDKALTLSIFTNEINPKSDSKVTWNAQLSELSLIGIKRKRSVWLKVSIYS